MLGRLHISLALYLGSIVVLPLAASRAQASPSPEADVPAPPTQDDTSRSGNDADSALVERERQLLEKGYALRQQGRDADALAVYREAYALRHDTKPLAQVALALESMGNWAQAYPILQQALADRAHLWILANRTPLENELTRIGLQLGRLTLEIQPAGATVRINGVTLGTAPFGQPLLVNPGKNTLEVELAGYAPYRREFEIEAGKPYRDIVHLTRGISSLYSTEARHMAGVGSKMPNHDAPPSRSNSLWLGSAVGGALIASAAIIPWSIANNKVDRLARDCNVNSNCPFGETSHDVRQLDHVTNALLFSGLGIAATSMVLYLTVPKAAPESGMGVTTSVTRDGAVVLYRSSY